MNRKRARTQWSLSQPAASFNTTATTAVTVATDGFHALLAPEGIWSSDGRMFAKDSITVRPGPNELPLMGLIENTESHDRAVNVGHFTKMTRKSDGWWEGTGVWADTPEALAVRARVRAGDVTGISVDAAVNEFDYLSPAASYDEMMAMLDGEMAAVVEPPEPERVTIDDVEYVVQPNVPDLMRATAVELLGATIVPFPAFGGATITDLATDDISPPETVAVTAAAAPVAPPRAWFDEPDTSLGAYDVEIDDDGRIHGYPAATWDACHISFPDECVNPPRSQTDYAYFRVGTVRCADGSRVRTGPLTLRGGHADRTLSAARAMAFYDDTDSAFADVSIGENKHGMWIAGALRPEVSAAQVRTAMASGFSGDWRGIGAGHELIALSAVNTPGFRHHASLYQQPDGLVASIILDMPRLDDSQHEADVLVASAINRIAASIGRSPEQRIEALRARVHPETVLPLTDPARALELQEAS